MQEGPRTASAVDCLGLRSLYETHRIDFAEAYVVARYPPGVNGFLFAGPDGGGPRRGNYRGQVWYPAVASTVDELCTFHDLRHTPAALLIRGGFIQR